MSNRIKIFMGLLVLAACSWALYSGMYYISHYLDTKRRPWAFSNDQNTKLLVGTWQGTVTDPGGIAKTIKLEIFSPLTEEERKKQIRKRPRRQSVGALSGGKYSFDGIATLQSQLGTEHYDIYGVVDKKDFHQFKLSFTPQDEALRILPNFAVRIAEKATWQADEMTLPLAFVYLQADGSSSSTSTGVVVDGKLVWQDNPQDKLVIVKLARISH